MNAVFFLLFSWGMVRARTRHQVLALALVGVTGAAVVAQPSITYAQGMIGAIESILNLINGDIHTALKWDQLRAERHEQPLPDRGLSNPAYQPGPGASDCESPTNFEIPCAAFSISASRARRCPRPRRLRA